MRIAPKNAEARIAARWIPKGYTLTVRPKDENVQAVVYVDPVKFAAIGYAGTAFNHSFHYTFRKQAEMEKYVKDFLAGQKRVADYKAEQTAKKKAKGGHTLKVGDILYTSGGYNMTTVRFYQVVKVAGAMVDVRPIQQKTVSSYDGGGTVVAVKDAFVSNGEITRHRPTADNDIRMGHTYAWFWDGKPKGFTDQD